MKRAVALVLALSSCDAKSAPADVPSAPAASSSPSVSSAAASGSALAPQPSAAPPPPPEPPSYAQSTADLLALMGPFPEGGKARRGETLEEFGERLFGLGGPGKTNQGNPELAMHAVSKSACKKGLEGVVLQTPEQKALCGAEMMVPIWTAKEGKEGAHVCIDVFEAPNKPCELPFVWTGPTPAREICRRLDKRLCTQDEWVTACSGDPEGGAPSRFAYGETLDLAICNTNKRAAAHQVGTTACDPNTIGAAYKTCGTHTEPSGSFPKCKSRFGVYDQHGNVAEIMTRWDPEEEETVSQLKGSAFFYVDVIPDKKRTKETYSDHCAHDPRWHVEPMKKAWHVNYHLGFRCCRDIPGKDPKKKR